MPSFGSGVVKFQSDVFPEMKEWLGSSSAAIESVDTLHPDASDEVRDTAPIEQNAVLQLAHLRTHAAVAARIAKKDIKRHGWADDNPKREMRFSVEVESIFCPLTERSKAETTRGVRSHA
ncbi:MAG: hypothetical protein AAF221_09180 [Pseudomonadota bacterium]